MSPLSPIDGFGETVLEFVQVKARLATYDIEKWQAWARLLEDWVKADDNTALPHAAAVTSVPEAFPD